MSNDIGGFTIPTENGFRVAAVVGGAAALAAALLTLAIPRATAPLPAPDAPQPGTSDAASAPEAGQLSTSTPHAPRG